MSQDEAFTPKRSLPRSPEQSHPGLATGAALVEPNPKKPKNQLEQDNTQEQVETIQDSEPEDLSETSDLEDTLITLPSNIDQLSSLIKSISISKRAVTTTQASKLHELVSNIKKLFMKQTTELFQLQGRFLEQKEGYEKQVKQLKATQAPKSNTAEVRSYADITKPKQARVLLVYPKEQNSNQTSEETKAIVESKMDPIAGKVQIDRIRKIRNGGVAILASEHQHTKLKVSLDEHFQTKTPNKSKPKIKISDVPSQLELEELTDLVYHQNFTEEFKTVDDFRKEFRGLFRTGPKNKDTTQWVCEVSGKILSANYQKLYIKYQACRVHDYYSITRCYKCQKYGHMAKACNSKDSTCGHCAKTGHSFNDCKETQWNFKCPNCKGQGLPFDHNVASDVCPILKREIKKVRLQTQYE